MILSKLLEVQTKSCSKMSLLLLPSSSLVDIYLSFAIQNYFVHVILLDNCLFNKGMDLVLSFSVCLFSQLLYILCFKSNQQLFCLVLTLCLFSFVFCLAWQKGRTSWLLLHESQFVDNNSPTFLILSFIFFYFL